MDPTTSTPSGVAIAAPSGPAFREETVEEAFRRYDVDHSGFLDFGEVSVALADMGALEGVLASKAGELFDRFDVDGDGQVDLDEFEVLVEKVKALRGSVASKATPEIPEGFAESAAALPLRKSFEAFAAFGKGARTGESVEHINGRDWSKLVKDCGLIGGPVNPAAADIIFASASRQAGQRVLRWEDDSFLHALAAVAAEHRVTFGQVAQRVSQCAPSETKTKGLQSSAAAGSSERAAAAAARVAAESANGPTPENATAPAALRSIFSQYATGAPGLPPLEALHALADLGLLRGASPDACQSAVTAAIASTAEDGNAPEGTVSFEAFSACGAKLASTRAKGNYRPPDDVHLQLDQRRALRESFEKFAGSKHGMKPDAWEVTMRACGLISAKCAEACTAVIFAKCKTGAGSRSLAPKVMSFEGFAQACAHVAAQYSVKFDVVAQRVVKCTPSDGADAASSPKAPQKPPSPNRIKQPASLGKAKSPASSPPAKATNDGNRADDVPATSPSAVASPASATAMSPSRDASVKGSSRASSTKSDSPLRAPLAEPKPIPPEYREDKALTQAFATFAEDDGAGSPWGPSLDNVRWGRVVRGCGLVGGSLTDATAQEIFRQSGTQLTDSGRMHFREFLHACAVTAGTHGVAFAEVAKRVVSVAAKQRQRMAEKAETDKKAAATATTAAKTKTKRKGLFGGIF
jgi:Ca2+-binding EF-hand superfamily protein